MIGIGLVLGKGDDGVRIDGVYEAVDGIGGIVLTLIENFAANFSGTNSIVIFAENFIDEILCQVIFRECLSDLTVKTPGVCQETTHA